MKRYYLLLGCVLLLMLSGCAAQEQDLKSACEELGGTWIEMADECEQISEEECKQLGGEFDECASACRHDPDAEFCAMVCVPVCSF